MTMTPELFDLYGADGRPLGRAKPREEVHRDGDWHRSAHVWVFTSDGRVLFQRRSAGKDTWPGRLDASIGGHYRAGEGADGVGREAQEELGLAITLDELLPLGVRRVESVEPGIRDRELQDIFLLRRDLPLSVYYPDRDEIEALTLLPATDAARLHAGTLTSVTAEILCLDETTLQLHTFTSADVIPGRGTYLAAIASAVADILAGRAPQELALSD